MHTISRRTALAAIPAVAAITALPALAGATDPDAELLSAVNDLDAAIRKHDLAGQAAHKAHDAMNYAVSPIDRREWEKEAGRTGYSALSDEWNRRGGVCIAASARVFDIPARTMRGVREKFRVFDGLMVDEVSDVVDGLCWQREDGAWAASIMRDLDRLEALS